MSHTSRQRSRLIRIGTVLAGALGIFWSTTAFRCPGPAPSYGSTGGAGGVGGAGGPGPGVTATGTGAQGGGGMNSDVSSSSGACSPNLMTDADNCGVCGHVCSLVSVTSVVCAQGKCVPTCEPGFFDGNTPVAPAPDDGCESRIHRVFITAQGVTTNMNGNMGALGGDAICQSDAIAAGLGANSSWKAWLSDQTTSPIARFSIDHGPYVLLDQTPVAQSFMTLTSSPLLHAIDRDEAGGTGVDVMVWTGTEQNGTASTIMGDNNQVITHCANWTQLGTGNNFALVGVSSATDSTWTSSPPAVFCSDVPNHLYCFEQ